MSTTREFRSTHLPFRLRWLIRVQEYLWTRDSAAAMLVSSVRARIMDAWFGR